MERSVDSIGACSLDVEASAELSGWSEASSAGTLRSASITPQVEPHLPSYLSLACTVNGYSTTTNYDPIRLARSRDASPQRFDSESLRNPVYSVTNNLLSPPNLVPLPLVNKTEMAEHTLTQHHHHHQEFYSSKTMFMTESRFSSNIFTKDTIDACLENGHKYQSSKYFTKNIVNGKCEQTVTKQEYSNSNGTEVKSFIQQRVERLYGPGALAQGFFVTKRMQGRNSESEDAKPKQEDRHSKSMNDKLLDDEPTMKQSTSSPTLPVLRHLRPEFRAQLPVLSPRKSTEFAMQKSLTVPKLKDEVNGHKIEEDEKIEVVLGNKNAQIISESGEKNGHYFLTILEEHSKRLLAMADQIEAELECPDLSEEIIGKIRSAAGKARLLVSQKMQQFKGLCTNNINQNVGDAFPTTNEDLQGFWDMVMLQVDHVDNLFKEIEALKRNNWKEEVVEKKAVNGSAKPKKTAVKPKSAVNEEARKQREAQRKKMIEDRRKAMKAQQQKSDIEIFVPESS